MAMQATRGIRDGSSVVELLPAMWKALGLIPGTDKTQNKTLKEIRDEGARPCAPHLGIRSAICATRSLDTHCVLGSPEL